MATYQALVLYGKNDLRLEQRRSSPLQPHSVRIKMHAVGICGSDMHYYREYANVGYPVLHPLILGHEATGVVESVGDAVTSLVPGDAVAVNPLSGCGVCPACKRGEPHLCGSCVFVGSAMTIPHVDGYFRDCFDVAAANCIKVPAGTDLNLLALADPLACALHAVSMCGSLIGKKVIITGSGSIGVLAAASARLAGAAKIVVAGRTQPALAIAKRMGADTVVNTREADIAEADADYGEYDIAVESTGALPAIRTCLDSLRRGGIMVQIGTPPAGDVPVPWVRFMEKEITVAGALRYAGEFGTAVALVIHHRIDLTPVLTGRFKLSRGAEAFAAAADRTNNMKVQFTA